MQYIRKEEQKTLAAQMITNMDSSCDRLLGANDFFKYQPS